jgi:dTDP-4-dehydrorhamnose reductase
VNPLRTLIVGANGFIGRHLLAAYRELDPETPGTARVAGPRIWPLDLANPNFDGLPLDGVREAVIAAAVPRVDDCERDPVGSRRVNVVGTLELVKRLSDRGIVPVFLSSDYVFAGTNPSGYSDDSETNPTTEYGRQKAAVEAALSTSGRPFTVLRLSKVFGLTRGDGTLLDEMAAKLAAGGIIAAATDQVFCPASVNDVVQAVLAVQRAGLRGIVNLVPAEAWSRYDLAIEVARAVGAAESQVRPISLDDLPGVKRPKCTKLIPDRDIGFTFTPVRDSIRKLAQEYAGE